MDGTQKLIFEQIQSWGRGKIFFAQDFTMLGTPENVRQALCTLTDERIISRIARGVYCYPKIVGEYAMKTIYPSTEDIAEAIAERACIRIVPYGDQSAYLMGFTSLQIGKYTYLTDGAPRTIKCNYTTITFNHTSEVRIFSFINQKMQLLSLAIRAVGKEGMTPEIREIAAEHLMKIPKEEFQEDIKLCPGWVADILFEL